MNRLEVDSLRYAISFDGNTFQVGCQDITFEDMQKIAKFVLEQKKEVFYEVGNKFKCEINNYTYILAYVENIGHRCRVHFVNIETGARYNDPFNVNSINKITSSELNLPRGFKKL